LGVGGDGLAVGVNGELLFPQVKESRCASIVVSTIPRVEIDRRVELGDGILEPALANKSNAPVKVGIRVAGVDLGGFSEALDGFLESTCKLESIAQVVQADGVIRFELKSLSIGLNRLFHLSLLLQGQSILDARLSTVGIVVTRVLGLDGLFLPALLKDIPFVEELIRSFALLSCSVSSDLCVGVMATSHVLNNMIQCTNF
jgi:hypothetical protein